MNSLSPGLAQACFELMGIVIRNNLSIQQIAASFASIGGIPIGKVLEMTQEIKWLRANDKGIAILTPTGQVLLNFQRYEYMVRQALLDYVDVAQPPWIQSASFGRSRVVSFADSGISQLLVEAKLVEGTDDAVIAFWDALAARARGKKNDRLTEIGRTGERLSLAYEESRTGKRPKWVAIDSNDDGYDVRSIIDAEDLRYLLIEVKSSVLGIRGSLHLTRYEWDRSKEFENHCFHLWDIKKISTPSVAVVELNEMEVHIPNDKGLGAWELVEIPFEVFKPKFKLFQNTDVMA